MKLILALLITLAVHAHAQLLPMPQIDRDIAAINQSAATTTYYGQLLVTALNRAHAAVWNLPDDRLAAVLNRLGPDQVAALIALHSQTAAALNASLDAAGDTGARALVNPGREYTIAADGTITVTPRPAAAEDPVLP